MALSFPYTNNASHDYLFSVLDAFKFYPEFTTFMRGLYHLIITKHFYMLTLGKV